MKDSLLFDFTVDKAKKIYSQQENLQPTFHWFGTPSQYKKSLTNSGLQSLLHPKLNQWTLK